jgi:RNA methyltransferase, TrmH family
MMAPRKVTSLANESVKAARALHMRKVRQQSGQFLVEGLKLVTEAIELGHAPEVLMFGPTATHPLLKRAEAATAAAGGEVLEVTPAILGKIARRENPQMVIGIFRQAYTPLEGLKPEDAACWIALEEVRDPGNLGAIIRTADAAGCGGVILIGDCCDPYSVEAVRATMGSIFAVPLVRTSLDDFLTWRSGWPGSVVGTLLTATDDYRAAPYRAPVLLAMGAEQSGLSPRLAQACDLAVKIPMRGRADSLNLAVATGIMTYAVTG